eukprot:gene5920-6852_t
MVDCEGPVKEFAKCTEDKLFSVIWECKEAQQKMKECLQAKETYGDEERMDQSLKEKGL